MTCFWVGNERLIHCQQGASPNQRDPRVEWAIFRRAGIGEGVCLALPNGTVLSYGRRTRFPETETRRIRESRKEALLARPQRRANDPSHARCDAGSARCRPLHHRHDRPARSHGDRGRASTCSPISSGWRRRKARFMFAPTPSPKPSAREPRQQPFEAAIGIASREQFVRLSLRSAHVSSAVARKATRSPEYSTRPASSSSSSATRTVARRSLRGPGQFVERDWRRAEQARRSARARPRLRRRSCRALRRRRRIRRRPAFEASIPDRPRTSACSPHSGSPGSPPASRMTARSLERIGSSAVSTSSALVQIDAPCFRRSLVPSARGSRGEPGTANT